MGEDPGVCTGGVGVESKKALHRDVLESQARVEGDLKVLEERESMWVLPPKSEIE